jgi:hypothetical protein
MLVEIVIIMSIVYYITVKLREEKVKSVNKYKIFEENNWIFNANISQYKTIIFRERNKTSNTYFLGVESLILFNQENDIIKHLACVINVDSKITIQNRIRIVEINKKNLFLISCNFEIDFSENDEINLDYIGVAIIDIRFYDKLITTFKRPYFLSSYKNKKYDNKAIVNCVHMTRCDGDCTDFRRKINSWSEILYRIGYNKIQIYIFNASQSFQDDLIKYDKFNMIELIDYSTSSDKLCQWHKLQFEEKQNNITKMLYLNCINLVNRIFTVKNDWWFGLHEKINTNACYLQHKYNYEFITNLDLDEIIFPRLNSLNENMNVFDIISKTNDLSKYNMYDFTKQLIKNKGNNIAFFLFPHSVYIGNFSQFLYLTKDFNKSSSQLIFPKINFIIHVDNKQTDNILNAKKMIYIVLNETQKYINNHEIHDKYFDSIVHNCPYRLGKSIYVTNNTITISQHGADNLKSGSRGLELKFEEGNILSHFRDDVSICHAHNTKPLSYLRFDFEYSIFVKKISCL